MRDGVDPENSIAQIGARFGVPVRVIAAIFGVSGPAVYRWQTDPRALSRSGPSVRALVHVALRLAEERDGSACLALGQRLTVCEQTRGPLATQYLFLSEYFGPPEKLA